MVSVALFCAAVCSLDITYLLMRLVVPAEEVWSGRVHSRWAFSWMVTWLVELPLWCQLFSDSSPLLIHEVANLTLTLYQAVLKLAPADPRGGQPHPDALPGS